MDGISRQIVCTWVLVGTAFTWKLLPPALGYPPGFFGWCLLLGGSFAAVFYVVGFCASREIALRHLRRRFTGEYRRMANAQYLTEPGGRPMEREVLPVTTGLWEEYSRVMTDGAGQLGVGALIRMDEALCEPLWLTD